MPGLGELTLDRDRGLYFSAPVLASTLGGTVGRILVSQDVLAADGQDLNDAVDAFLSGDDTELRNATNDVFAYYLDTVRAFREPGPVHLLPSIADPAAVWDHVSFGNEFLIERDARDGDQVYVSIECECSWEPDHGLQLVFRGGRVVSKVGPYDGHVTNANAYARADLGTAVYVSPFAL